MAAIAGDVDSLRVVVRIRPLTPVEVEAGEEEDTIVAGSGELTIERAGETSTFAGYSHVFTAEHDNAAVYAAAVQPMVGAVMEGGTACTFAYGHTGAGKTHTLLGYDGEAGVFRLIAQEMLDRCPDDCKLAISFVELYQRNVFDLLNDRAECSVLEGEDGVVRVRSVAERTVEGFVYMRDQAVTHACTLEEVDAVLAGGLALRSVGCSTTHDRSSRSHAILTMEIVSEELQAAREAVVDAKARLTPVGADLATRQIHLQSLLYQRMPDGTYSTTAMEDVVGFDFDAFEEAKAATAAAEAVVKEAQDAEAAVQARGPPCLCGTAVVIDLAGMEYGSDRGASRERTAEERDEAKRINSSLLALKECIRALTARQKHVPFRNSQLTKLLRHHLLAKQSLTAMIANIAPTAAHCKRTDNVLRYAGLVADALGGKAAGGKRRGRSRAKKSRGAPAWLREKRAAARRTREEAKAAEAGGAGEE